MEISTFRVFQMKRLGKNKAGLLTVLSPVGHHYYPSKLLTVHTSYTGSHNENAGSPTYAFSTKVNVCSVETVL
jgi:hypothetical protein